MKHLKVNKDKCTGCHLCELACSYTHTGGYNTRTSFIHIRTDESKWYSFPVICESCSEPFCQKACKFGAISRCEATGAMKIDPEKCKKCKACVRACPFGAVKLFSRPGYAPVGMCDLCGGDPSCVKVCPGKAIEYIDVQY